MLMLSEAIFCFTVCKSIKFHIYLSESDLINNISNNEYYKLESLNNIIITVHLKCILHHKHF